MNWLEIEQRWAEMTRRTLHTGAMVQPQPGTGTLPAPRPDTALPPSPVQNVMSDA